MSVSNIGMFKDTLIKHSKVSNSYLHNKCKICLFIAFFEINMSMHEPEGRVSYSVNRDILWFCLKCDYFGYFCEYLLGRIDSS